MADFHPGAMGGATKIYSRWQVLGKGTLAGGDIWTWPGLTKQTYNLKDTSLQLAWWILIYHLLLQEASARNSSAIAPRWASLG
jgi:hypothetical protein